MIKVTASSATPVELIAQYLVTDEVYQALIESPELREAFLVETGQVAAIVDRLGEETVPGKVYERPIVEILLPKINSDKGVGYHSRL